MTWHIPDSIIDAYLSGQVGDADAWSVEAHLVSCDECRRALSNAAHSDPDTVTDRVWETVSARLSPSGVARPGTRWRGSWVMVASGPAARWAWLASCAVVIVLAVVLGVYQGSAPWLGVVAPLLPVMGVGMSYGSGLDHSYEVIASTPGGGLKLLLIRTVAVLAVSTPTVLVAGLLIGYGSPWHWMAASLGLTLMALALGSVVGVERAAALVGVAWVAASGAPLLRSSSVPVWLAPESLSTWLVVIVTAGVLVALRRKAFNNLPLPNLKVEVPN